MIRVAMAALAAFLCTAPVTQAQEAERTAREMFETIQVYGLPWGSVERGQKIAMLSIPDKGSIHVIAHPERVHQSQKLVMLFISGGDPTKISTIVDLGPIGKAHGVELVSGIGYSPDQIKEGYGDILACFDQTARTGKLCEKPEMMLALLGPQKQ
jgi:hypothetical protein